MPPMPLDIAKSVKLPLEDTKLTFMTMLPVTNYTYLERLRRDLSTYAGRRYIHAYPNKLQTKDMCLANGDIFVVLSHMMTRLCL